SVTTACTTVSSVAPEVQWGDWNGDGFADLLCVINSSTPSFYVYPSTGSMISASTVQISGEQTQKCWPALPGLTFAKDFNGDGLVDFGCLEQGSTNFNYVAVLSGGNVQTSNHKAQRV